jgi:CheY-like chemotaxis protein
MANTTVGVPTLAALNIIEPVSQYDITFSRDISIFEAIKPEFDVALIENKGEILGVIRRQKLVQEVVRYCESLQGRQFMLMEQLGAKAQLIEATAGELNDSLTVIQGILALLEQSPGLSNEQKHLLHRLRRTAKRANAVTNTLQSMTMINQSAAVDYEEVDLKKSLQELVARYRVSEPNVQFMFESEDEMKTQANAPILMRCCRGLIDNLVRLTPVGETVRVELARELTGDSRRPEVILRFYNGEKRESRPALENSTDFLSNNGLTKVLLKELFITHAGSYIAVGDQNFQTYFELRLPTVVDTTMSELPSHVLVVEDDEDIRNMIEEVIRGLGFPVIKAADGQEAYESFLIQKPALVLADVRMPRLNGIEMAAAMKRIDRAVPVVLFSGQMPNLVQDRLNNVVDADHVLYKPFSNEDIATSVGLFIGEGSSLQKPTVL